MSKMKYEPIRWMRAVLKEETLWNDSHDVE